ncbi:MAG: phenylacetate-CoA oxygenase subunit PaaI [Acidobacteria bacterium]|nr:phenylacetate-CoA oxygenase subunit PaaI [Acidobacteriota bacterium]
MDKQSTFDDWIELFRAWQKNLGLNQKEIEKYQFETKYDQIPQSEIEFGHYRGERKWEKILHVPDQRIRDALLHLIIYQGDTEFASVEQQRNLLNTAPSDYDFLGLMRVMCEEMRHGWQMSTLLIDHFGQTGKTEAQKMLQRCADQQQRLLGSFNQPVNHWIDFFTYAEFIDRDGKFQLTMLSTSAFAPLARSMPPMLREEYYHLLTGNTGLMRTLKAGRVPVEIIQKYFNKWIPTAYDLFGTDYSSMARWSYVWGVKGRFDERENSQEPDLDNLNEHNRKLYVKEIQTYIEAMNKIRPEGSPELYVPSTCFNRSIGEFAGKSYDPHGNLLTQEEYDLNQDEFLPSEKDLEVLRGIFKNQDWIIQVKSGA